MFRLDRFGRRPIGTRGSALLGMTERDRTDERTLLGRDPVVSRLQAAVAAAASGTADRVVLVGGPGSGRTAVLDHLAESAGDMTVLRANPVASEASLAYAALFDLCQPLLDELDRLAEIPRRTLSAALGLGGSGGAAGTMAVGASLLSLLVGASQARPVLLLFDDADRADAETVEAVIFAVRRLRHDAVATVVATSEDGAPWAVGDAFECVDLAPLERDEAATLLERSCPVAPDPAVRDALLEVAQGNPLALTLLPRSLSLPQLRGRWPLRHPIPSPDRLGDVVAADLEGLDDARQHALLMVATSLTGARAAITAALVALDLPADLLDELVRSGHLVSDGGRIRFARPLVRSVTYARADVGDRRRAHAALAEVLGGELSLEQRAWHLSAAAVGPDATAADLLEQSAAELLSRGASSAAAVAFDRSVALTLDRRVRARRRVAAASALLAVGETDRAGIHLDAAETESNDLDVTIGVRHLRGRVLVNQGSGAAAQQMFLDGARLARRMDPQRAATMLCEAALAAVHGRRLEDARSLAVNARATAGVDGSAAVLAGLVHATVLLASGETRAGRAALRTHLGGLDPVAATGPAAPVYDGAALALVWAERYRDARRLLDSVIAERRRAMAFGLLPSSLCMRALLGHRTGDTTRAFADAVEALRLMEGDHCQAQRASALAVLASVESTLGLRRACLEHVRLCLAALGDRGRRSTLRMGARSAAASVELSYGDADAAIEWLAPLLEQTSEIGAANPATVMWEPDLIEALAAVGRGDEARALLERFEARAKEAGNRRAEGAAARGAGILAEDDDAAADAFATSIEHYRTPYHPVGTGRTLLAWGTRLAAAGRRDEAIDLLDRARRELDDAGAGGWAGRAAAALVDLGASTGTRTGLGDLPTDVAEVALLTAAGFDVDKVADHVLASPRTVVRLLDEAAAATGERPAHVAVVPDATGGDADDAEDEASAAGDVDVEPGTWFRVQVLGAFAVTGPTGDATPAAGLGARLVRLLAVSAPGGIAVDEAAELLWPDLDSGRGRARLRNVLSRLRATSGELVVRAGDSLRLHPGTTVDLRAFEERAVEALTAAARGDGAAAGLAKAALALHTGELLPDLLYEAWTVAPRERARRRLLDLLGVLADHHRSTGRLDDAVRVLERAMVLDVYDEERYVVAAEVRRQQGRHGAAMALLAKARAIVADLGLPPSPRLVEVERSLHT